MGGRNVNVDVTYNSNGNLVGLAWKFHIVWQGFRPRNYYLMVAPIVSSHVEPDRLDVSIVVRRRSMY